MLACVRRILSLFMVAASLLAEPAHSLIQARLDSTKSGDWAVVQLDQIPLLWVIEPSAGWLSWFEWELPDALAESDSTQLQLWLKSGYAIRTAKIYAINATTSQMLYWDASEQSWLPMDQTQALISNLLALPLKALPELDQRRIGPRPRIDQDDTRPLWRPPMSRHTTKTLVWRGFWSNDTSPLANAEIVIYNSATDDPHWPPLLPTHVYAERVGLRWSLKVLNGGRGLMLPPAYKQLLSELPMALMLSNEKDTQSTTN